MNQSHKVLANHSIQIGSQHDGPYSNNQSALPTIKTARQITFTQDLRGQERFVPSNARVIQLNNLISDSQRLAANPNNTIQGQVSKFDFLKRRRSDFVNKTKTLEHSPMDNRPD